MNTEEKTLLGIAFVLVLLIAFSIGRKQGFEDANERPEPQILSEIALRYFEVYGSPETEKQQSNYEYIIYND